MLDELDTLPVIAGAGGGGKSGAGSGGLAEQSDSLKSTSYAQVLDLVSEGEIGGLVAGLKSIYLDGVPIQNADGSNNFTGVTYASTTGTQTQGVIAGYDETRSEFVVGVEAKISSGPIARAISSANVTSVVVTVQLPALTYLDAQGNLGGSSVNFAIDVQVNGGGWVEKVNDTITGKSSGTYQRQYRILLPTGATRNVRLRRITADSSSGSLNNKTYFQSYTEIIDAKLSYPNSALVAVKVDASQFRSVPTRGYDMKLLLVRFPTNATVRADGSLAYSGTWDGTFQVGWCADPAWAYYDLVTANRYGLGDYLGTNPLSKWDCYTISKYCAELVPDGFGGTEPRFTCNVWINTRQEAYKLLADLTSCFRGMAYWGTGQIAMVQDAPRDPSYLFTNANVVDGMFRYEGSSAKARHSVALVTYNDPADLYRQKIEYVEDTAAIARYGVITTEIVAFGCASRGQAARAGRWLLYSERSETEMVTFRTGGEGAICKPGDVVKIADQHRAGARLGGRVSAASATSITVDALPSVPPAGSTIYVLGTDGVVQQRTTGTVTGNAIAVSPNLSPVPQAGAIWVVATSTVDAQTFRVLSVAETDTGEHDILAVAHNPAKFAAIETGLKIQARNVSSLNPVPAPPGSLAFTQGIVSIQGVPQLRLTVKWQAATGADRYAIEWRAASGNWQAGATRATEFDIDGAQVTTYEVRVKAVSFAGGQSSSLYGSYTITPSALAAAQAAYQASTTAGAIVGQGDLATQNKATLPFGTNLAVNSELTLIDPTYAPTNVPFGWQPGWPGNSTNLGSVAFNDRRVQLKDGSYAFARDLTGAPNGSVVDCLNSYPYSGPVARVCVPIVPGEQIAASALIGHQNCTGAYLVVGFYDENGVEVDEYGGTTVTNDIGAAAYGGLTRKDLALATRTITVPADGSGSGTGKRRWAMMWVRFTISGSPVNPRLVVAAPMLAKVAPGQTAIPAYGPGPSDRQASYGAVTGTSLISPTYGTLTDSQVKTDLGTAAGIAGQSPWATFNQYTPAQVTNPGANLIFNSNFAIGTLGWTVNAWAGPQKAAGDVGAYYMATGTNNNYLYTSDPTKQPVFPNLNYTFQVWAAANGTSTGTAQPYIYIDWHRSDGTFISSSAAAYIAVGVGYQTFWITATSPAAAAYARVVFTSNLIATGGGWVYTSKWKLELGGSPTPWSDDATNGALYQSGQTIDALKPAEVGANVTETRTSAAIAGQGDLATQNKASLPFGVNAFANSDLTTSSAGWEFVYGNNASLGGSGGRNAVTGYYGKRNVAHTAIFSGSAISSSTYMFGPSTKGFWAGGAADVKRYGLPVKPGDRVFLGGKYAVHGGTQLNIRARFYAETGTLLNEQDAGATIGNGRAGGPTAANGDPANFSEQGAFFTVPAGAAFVLWGCFTYAAGGDTSIYIFVCEPFITQVPAGQTGFPPYTPGPPDRAADVTGENTSADTSAVAGRAAGDVAGTINPGGGVAANKVSTASMVAGAVTQVANAFSSSPAALASGPSGPTSVLSATITVAAGDYVLVDFVGNGQFTSSGAGAGVLYETAIYVDGADSGYGWVNQQLPTANASFYGGYSLASGTIALTGLAAGTHTIALMMRGTPVASTGWTITWGPYATWRSLTLFKGQR